MFEPLGWYARGTIPGAEFGKGDEQFPGGRHMTNPWQGDFPHQNLAADGFERISRVAAFPADGYGLYDDDRQCLGRDRRLVFPKARALCSESLLYPAKSSRRGSMGELQLLSAEISRIPRKVLKGGSHLWLQLLPPLSSDRASCRADRHISKPRRLQVHH